MWMNAKLYLASVKEATASTQWGPLNVNALLGTNSTRFRRNVKVFVAWVNVIIPLAATSASVLRDITPLLMDPGVLCRSFYMQHNLFNYLYALLFLTDTRGGYCYGSLLNGRCASQNSQLMTKFQCCCDSGRCWSDGSMPEMCPIRGTGGVKNDLTG
ncbi:hypothetical protein XENOCAPTIV_001184 [Xenoophorus captivus]|uniref:TB domain-containing protein n=1 Tax=Xenoophorus captivus TaxID=1517983 RepID=A0ABV0RN15_9TELE